MPITDSAIPRPVPGAFPGLRLALGCALLGALVLTPLPARSGIGLEPPPRAPVHRIFHDPAEYGAFRAGSPLLRARPPATPLVESRTPFTSKRVTIDSTGAHYQPRSAGFDEGPPITLPLARYLAMGNRHLYRTKWRQEVREGMRRESRLGEGRRGRLEWRVPIPAPPVVRRFIGDEGSLRINGSHTASIGGKSSWTDNEVRTLAGGSSKFPALSMDQESDFSVEGKVGEAINIRINQDTRGLSSSFGQNLQDQLDQIKLDYKGDEDNIFQEVQAGNTTLSLPNTRFVGFNQQHKGLFGIRAKGRLGPFGFTTIASHEKSESNRQSFRGGAQVDTTEIRDYEYVRNQFFFLDHNYKESLQDYAAVSTSDFRPEVPVDERTLQVYVNDFNVNNDAEQLARPGRAQADLGDAGNDSTGHREVGTWHRLDPDDDYILDAPLGSITLRRPVQDRHALAVTYRAGDREVGSAAADQDSLRLKLIKARDSRPGFPTWDLEWKNVYRIVRGFARGRQFDRQRIRVEILREVPGKEPESTQGGRSYLRLMGLDTHGQDAGTPPDQIIDADYDGLREDLGVLILPDQRPFDPQLSKYGLEDRVPEIYDTEQHRDHVEASRYIIQVINSSSEQRINLTQGRLTSIDVESVEVRLDGRQLTQNVDYSVTYTGEVQFLGAAADQVADPAADLEITFESQDLIGLGRQQKTLLGTRAEYEFLGGDGVVGGTLIYNNQSGDRRVRVGNEPARTVLWDMDVRATFRAPLLTRVVDALPLLTTTQASKVTVQAEIAQSRPNLNTRGKAFIDDFEGSEHSTLLPVFYSRWTPASVPADGGLTLENRGPTLWYNPYDRVQRTSIWPGQRDQVEARNEQTDVLTLKVTPPEGAGVTTWGGVMTDFSGGVRDFSQSKFVGIWLRGQSGSLQLHLGDISEDWIPNGRIDTEDLPLRGRAIGDGTLSEEEDVGIDGRTDEEELDYYLTRDTEVTAEELEGLSFSDKSSRFGDLIRALGRDPGDAEGDNWDYDPTRDRHNYTRYNGTEGNRRVREHPDTEDLNGDGNLNQRNDYYHYEIDLTRDRHEPGTCSEPLVAGECRGWRLFRLRLFDESVRRIGSPDSSRIGYARLIFATQNGPAEADSVAIALVEIAVNEWQGDGVSRYDPDAFDVTEEELFEVAVIGTDENLGYKPPPGVKGERSTTSRVREREQSLVLDFVNLGAGHEASATRVLTRNSDYTKYRRLRMFAHGDSNAAYVVPPDSSNLELFLRFGRDDLNYYEYVTPLFPGWDERNEVEIDLRLMSRLKGELEGRVDTATGLQLVELDTVVVDPGVRDGAPAVYRVSGTPSMQQVRQLRLGLRNRGADGSLSGAVYVDELRLDQARNDPGAAVYARINTQLADFMDVDASVDWRAENYRTITSTGRKSSDMRSGLSTTTHLDKFLPGSWGFSVPVKVTLSHSQSLPRFAPNSDVELTPSEKDSMRSEQVKRHVEVSVSKRAGRHWAARWTIDQMNLRWSSSIDDRLSPVTPVDSREAQTGSFRYKMPLPKPKWKYLGWLPEYMPKSMRNSELSPLPATASYSVNVNRQESATWKRTQIDTTFNEVFTLKEIYATKVNPLRSLTSDYNLQVHRDLRKKYDPGSLAFGREVGRNQKADLRLQLRWVSWLDPNITFQANYQEDSDPRRSRQTAFTDTVDGRLRVVRTLDITSRNTFTTRVNLRLPALLKAVGAPGRRSQAGPRRRSEEGEEEEGPGQPFFLRRFLHFSSSYVEPFSYTWRRNTDARNYNLVERPDLAYQLGFGDSLLVEQRAAGLTRTDSWNRSANTDLGSGLRLPLGFSVKPTFKEQVSWRSGSSQNRIRVERQLTWPGLAVAWSRADRVPLLRRYLNSAQVNVRMQSARTEQAEGSLEPANLIEESTKREWNVSWTGQWRIGPTTRLEMRRSRNESVNYELADLSTSEASLGKRPPLRGRGVDERRSTNLETRYKLRPRKLPLIGTLKSNLDLKLSLTLESQARENATGELDLQAFDSTDRWEVRLDGTYNFSESFRGSGLIRLENRTPQNHRTRKVREVKVGGTLFFR